MFYQYIIYIYIYIYIYIASPFKLSLKHPFIISETYHERIHETYMWCMCTEELYVNRVCPLFQFSYKDGCFSKVPF